MIKHAVFDAYGTLFDVAGAARAAAAEPGGAAIAGLWEGLARDWRDKQLCYSWLRAAAGVHADFAQVTADGLDWALAARGIGDAGLRARLLALYDHLPAYPEAAAVLTALRARGLGTAILSNGTPAMLTAATETAGLGGLVDAALSAQEVGVFKPSPRVYGLVEARLGAGPGEVLFVSANGWDAAAAAGFGFSVAWVNRAGAPRERLWAEPAHEIDDLNGLLELV